MADESVQNERKNTANRKVLVGTVVSRKMKDTVVVKVVRYVKHPKYKKYVKQVKRYKAHDIAGEREVGEEVSIRETRPLSKDKHFIVIAVGDGK